MTGEEQNENLLYDDENQKDIDLKLNNNTRRNFIFIYTLILNLSKI